MNSQQFCGHLFIIKSQGLAASDPYKVEIYLDMNEFEYLGLEAQGRPSPDHVLVGDTGAEALQRAKDQINGQLLLL